MLSDIQERPSPNHGPRRGAGRIDMLVLHYTGMPTAAAALDRLCDGASEVSAHYLIAEDGAVWRLVDEARRAWHAGRSCWAGETDINSRSIGIELANPGHGPHYRPFPDAQMAALEALASGIIARHPIPHHRVLAHSDIAPARKRDPGELFDWRRLSRAGIGLWSEAEPGAIPGKSGQDEPGAALLMRQFGYSDSSSAAIAAFQIHFRPSSVTGIADAETVARLADLVKRAGLA